MSRIGKLPITVPVGVTITVGDDHTVTVKGPKGQLSERISGRITLEQENNTLRILRASDAQQDRALHGLSRTLVNNMVTGVSEGFVKNLQIVGVGYRVQKQGNKIVLNVGYSHPIEFEESGAIEFDVPAPNKIVVKGVSKQEVGQVAANIRAARPPEPYKGKGIRYEGENVRRKEGKTGNK